MFIKGSGRPDFRYGRIREIRLFSINRHILEENTGRYILKLHTKAYLILHNKPRHIKRFPEVESFWPRLKTLENLTAYLAGYPACHIRYPAGYKNGRKSIESLRT